MLKSATEADLRSRLATYHDADVATSPTSSTTAVGGIQLVVWNILNDNSGYNRFIGNALGKGDFETASSVGGTRSTYPVNIGSVNKVTLVGAGSRDVAVLAPLPEPETYGMMFAGLGLMGFVVRRRRQYAV